MRFGFLVLGVFLAWPFSARAQGVAPSIVTYPAPGNAYVGDLLTLTAAVDGTAPINFQWFKDGTLIAGATNTSLTRGPLALSDTGVYRLDASNAFGTATTIGVLIVVSKRPQTITFNAPATSVTASSLTLSASASSGLPVTFSLVSGSATLNGNLLTATSGSVVVRAAQAGNATYDPAESVDRTITFVTGAISPFITSPPANQTITAGGSVTFRATAIGTPLPTYQWEKDGTALAGATTNALALTGVTLADAGRYRVTVTNVAGTATAAATLTVQTAPVITTQPASATVFAGSAASFSVAVTAIPAAAFQWRKNGLAISGATGSTLEFARTAAADAARYDVVVTNSLGSVTSTPATLTVNVRDFTGTYLGRIDDTGGATGGQFALLVRANRSATLLARAPGNTTAILANLTIDLTGSFAVTANTLGSASVAASIRGSIDEVAGTVSGTMSAGTTVVNFSGTRAATADTSGGRAGSYAGAVVGSAAAEVFAIVAPDGDTLLVLTNTTGVDSARATLSSTGQFSVGRPGIGPLFSLTFDRGFMAGALGATAAPPMILGALDAQLGTERLVNVSVRSTTANAAPLITGFVINGTAPKQVLIRAAGPALAQAPFNVAGTLNDPTLLVFRGSTPVAQNDDWGTPAQNAPAVTAAATRTGAFPFRVGSNDAAIATTLPPAAYSAEIGGGNGIVLAEVYEDLATGETPGARRLVNVSARGFVAPGAPLIAGFVVSGRAPVRVLIRGIGPTLGTPPFNVAGALANPQLTLFRGSTALKNNDDWFRDADAALIRDTAARVGAFPLAPQSVDAAMLIYLEPGAYTAQINGPANAPAATGAGIALVEVYAAP